jgi:hypothetical protein
VRESLVDWLKKEQQLLSRRVVQKLATQLLNRFAL